MSGKKAGENSTTMSIHAHILELRKRLFVLALVFLVASVVAYVFRENIAQLLMAPLEGQKLYNLTPGGQFSFILKIIMWAGFAATIPFLVAAIYSFIAPALPKKAQRQGPKVLFFSMLLLVSGAVFGYVYAIPGAMRFLLSFADGLVTPMITGESYLSFVLAYTVGLGVLFQIPLLMIIANWITPLKPKVLLNMERYVIVVAFIAAAIITPTPDPANQAIIAAPVIAMYQVGFAAVLVSHRGARRQDKKSVARNKATKSLEAVKPSALPGASELAKHTSVAQAPSAITTTTKPRLVSDIHPVKKKPHMTHRPLPSRPSVLSVPAAPTRNARVTPPARPTARQGKYLDGVSMSYRSNLYTA